MNPNKEEKKMLCEELNLNRLIDIFNGLFNLFDTCHLLQIDKSLAMRSWGHLLIMSIDPYVPLCSVEEL